MIQKFVAVSAVSALSLAFFFSSAAEARGHGGFGRRTSSYSSPSYHQTYHAPPAQAPHATTPMAPPAAAPAGPSMLGTIASTAAGTAGGVVAGNAISHAFEGHSDSDSAKHGDSAAPVSHQISEEPATVAVVPADSAGKPALPQASDPCTPENEAKNPRIEELCGQLHQEMRKVNETVKDKAAAQK